MSFIEIGGYRFYRDGDLVQAPGGPRESTQEARAFDRLAEKAGALQLINPGMLTVQERRNLHKRIARLVIRLKACAKDVYRIQRPQ